MFYFDYFNEDVGNQDYVINNLLAKTTYDKIFLGSDWHLFKKEVTGEPQKESKFDLNKYILKHNLRIKPTDIYIYLGDLAHKKCSLEHYTKLRSFVNKLNGIKILIKGNHDLEDDDYYLSCGFSYVFNTLQFDNIVFSHKPVALNDYPGAKYNIHGHLHQYKIYWDGKVNPENHLGIYTGNHEILSLKYIMDHRKEIEDENVEMFSQPDKHLAYCKNEINKYEKICKKFFKLYPEYKRMNKSERYLAQEEMVRKFLKIKEVRTNEELIGWKQMKITNVKEYNKLTYKPDDINDYYHFVILNKDNNLVIDLNPDLIDWDKQYVYQHGKNVLRFKWGIAFKLVRWDDEEMFEFPQTKIIQSIEGRGLNEGLDDYKKYNFDFLEFPSKESIKHLKNDVGCYNLDNVIDNSIGEVIIDKDTKSIAGHVFVNIDEEKGLIFSLKVLKKYRNLGLGHKLLDDAIKKYGGYNLIVNKDNKFAIDMYKRKGFKIVGRCKDEYNNNAESYVMTLKKK